MNTQQQEAPRTFDIKPATRTTTRSNGSTITMFRNFWKERVKRADERYPTTYTIYLSGQGMNGGTIEHLPSLEQAERQLEALVKSPTTEWTYGMIYEVRPVIRRGMQYTTKPKKDD
jgi:hypothetical protein